MCEKVNIPEWLNFVWFQNISIKTSTFFFRVCIVTTIDHTEIIDLEILVCFSKIKANFVNLSRVQKLIKSLQ